MATGTFCGFIVILIATFAGFILRADINKRFDIFFSLIGGALFITSGVMIIEAWEHSFRTRTRDLAILKGTISIINGVLCVLDAIFTFKGDWQRIIGDMFNRKYGTYRIDDNNHNNNSDV